MCPPSPAQRVKKESYVSSDYFHLFKRAPVLVLERDPVQAIPSLERSGSKAWPGARRHSAAVEQAAGTDCTAQCLLAPRPKQPLIFSLTASHLPAPTACAHAHLPKVAPSGVIQNDGARHIARAMQLQAHSAAGARRRLATTGADAHL